MDIKTVGALYPKLVRQPDSFTIEGSSAGGKSWRGLPLCLSTEITLASRLDAATGGMGTRMTVIPIGDDGRMGADQFRTSASANANTKKDNTENG